MANKIEHKKIFLPIWMWIIILMEVVLVLFFSAGTAMNPQNFIPNVTELNYVTQLYITRNVTAVLGLIIALLFRSHKVLFVMLIVRMATDISDVFTVYAFDAEAIKSSVPMVLVLLIIIPLFAIRHLWKRIKKERY